MRPGYQMTEAGVDGTDVGLWESTPDELGTAVSVIVVVPLELSWPEHHSPWKTGTVLVLT